MSIMIKSEKEFKEQNKIGGLILYSKYYDCKPYVDIKRLRKDFKEELYKKRIEKVLILTENFVKKQNKKIKYDKPLFCEKLEGSIYLEKYKMDVTYHPYGDVIILTK
jgi:hypothetical protein